MMGKEITPQAAVLGAVKAFKSEVDEILKKAPGPRNLKLGDAPFVVCHWDTFDNETHKIADCETLQEAELFVTAYYGDRIRDDGADQSDIVDIDGNVVKSYKVG